MWIYIPSKNTASKAGALACSCWGGGRPPPSCTTHEEQSPCVPQIACGSGGPPWRPSRRPGKSGSGCPGHHKKNSLEIVVVINVVLFIAQSSSSSLEMTRSPLTSSSDDTSLSQLPSSMTAAKEAEEAAAAEAEFHILGIWLCCVLFLCDVRAHKSELLGMKTAYAMTFGGD